LPPSGSLVQRTNGDALLICEQRQVKCAWDVSALVFRGGTHVNYGPAWAEAQEISDIKSIRHGATRQYFSISKHYHTPLVLVFGNYLEQLGWRGGE
jgi:hypothetical protein